MQQGFDYIIIGSGSAGAVLAARLSEDPAIRILLLEAGPRDRHPLQLMPLAFARVATGKIGTWQYESEPEPGLFGRRLPIPRGRTLGGTSSINAMIAIRGHRLDYDSWAAMGLPGWSYDDVLPYFRKLENSWRGGCEFHGDAGPVGISVMQGAEMVWEPLRQAAQAAGIPHCDDPNGAVQDGISRMESTLSSGKRASTARAYLYPALHRSNLTVATGALASRIIIHNGKATGVEYQQGRQARIAHADCEVICAGGAYNSPQLLMLSGIGPADELRQLGIAPCHDLPGVGSNLADHPNIINEYELCADEGLNRYLRMDRAIFHGARWFASNRGPFAYTGTAANVFVRSQAALDQPDVQMMCMPISGNARMWVPPFQASRPSHLSVRTGYLHPKSRGWVKLRSADPRDPPRIFNNMFAEPDDLQGMVRALKLAREIYAQSPLAQLIRAETLPGKAVQGDAQLADHIRANAGHRAHPVGTCAMGTGEGAVVDPRLRLHGIDRLRVVDASIMPALPSGNTNLPTIMIAEKAADMIRGLD